MNKPRKFKGLRAQSFRAGVLGSSEVSRHTIDSGLMDIERLSDIANGLSLSQQLRDKLDLVRVKLPWPAKPYAALFRCLATRSGPFADQVSFDSAIPANTVMIIFPACVVVLAHDSGTDWNLLSVL